MAAKKKAPRAPGRDKLSNRELVSLLRRQHDLEALVKAQGERIDELEAQSAENRDNLESLLDVRDSETVERITAALGGQPPEVKTNAPAGAQPHTVRVVEGSNVSSTNLPATCPKCGTRTGVGFGLAGGGFGPYVACLNDSCDFFSKRHTEPEPAATAVSVVEANHE